MKRRHPEDRCPPVALKYATWITTEQRLEHEHAADDHQQQLLLDENGDRAERGAERQRPDVAHEDLGGVRAYQRNPSEAPTSEPQKIVSSAAGGKCTSSR